MAVATSLHAGGARDVVVLTVGGCLDYTDYFVICHGLSPPHLKALAQIVSETAKTFEATIGHVEGLSGLLWIVFDLHGVVAHIFSEEGRSYYDLERLWRDAPKRTVTGNPR